MTDPAQKTATLTVQVGSDPVDVMASCNDPKDSILIGVKVNGTLAGIMKCQGTPQLIGLPVHPGQQARITLVPASGLGLPDISTDWQFAAYAWTPPATARTAPAAPQLPQSNTGPNTTAGHGTALRKLIAIRRGTWPRDRTATFTFTVHRHRHRHRKFDISTVCAGLIGGRLQVSHQIDGSRSEAVPCTPAGPKQLDNEGGLLIGSGERITLTYNTQAPGSYFAADYAKRAASWTIAVYEEQS